MVAPRRLPCPCGGQGRIWCMLVRLWCMLVWLWCAKRCPARAEGRAGKIGAPECAMVRAWCCQDRAVMRRMLPCPRGGQGRKIWCCQDRVWCALVLPGMCHGAPDSLLGAPELCTNQMLPCPRGGQGSVSKM
ncbi:uncharacterized protein DS421_1g19310 [Arachis hypogaea]|nr:uncharacterized protein DS421_1g19310 [Arachis hypogaea]